jgi:hypothetical protein
MATRNSTILNNPSGVGVQSFTIKSCAWTGLLNGDDGVPFSYPDWADRCIQVFGTFGVGGSISIQGSNDGVNYSTLTDQNGVLMTFTANAIKQMSEAPLYIKPIVTAGDGTTNLSAVLVARRLYVFA